MRGGRAVGGRGGRRRLRGYHGEEKATLLILAHEYDVCLHHTAGPWTWHWFMFTDQLKDWSA
jgi:hypothetical protein